MKRTHVVFGAGGGLGSAIVRKLAGDGQSVCAVVRNIERARQALPENVRLEMADAGDARSIHKACRDAAVIYHCINVPFDSHETVMPKVTDNILAVAREAGAVLMFPGNVYGYGPLQRVPADEAHPLMANTGAGRLRNRLEQQLLDAHRAGHVRVVIPRLASLYGPNVTSRLSLPIFRAALSGAAASWPGKPDVPHDLLYVDDAGAASVLLASREETFGQSWHVPGPGPLTGRQFVEMVYAAAGTEPAIEPVKEDALKFSGGGMAESAELSDAMYLYEHPLVLDGGKFARAFPSFRYTGHEEGVRRTLEWLQQHTAV